MPSFSIVRRRKRRRNMTQLAIHRGGRGRWVSDKAAPKPRRRRRKAKSASKPKRKRRGGGRRKARGGRKASRRKKNPFRRRRNRRRARRNSGLYLTNRPRRRRRRRSSAVLFNRPRRRRRNPFGLTRRRRRRNRRHGRARRRNPFRLRRRNPGWGIMSNVRDVLSIHTGKDVLAGTFGLSASLWGPKLLGHLVWAPLGRGYGGVATSVFSSIVASKVMGYVSPSRSRLTLVAGLLGSFAGLLSAIHCGWRTNVLPFETGLLACALPTVPPPAAAPGSPAALALASGMPLAKVRAAGLPGLSGYGGGNSAGMQVLLSNEQAFRNAVGGSSIGSLNDYVQVPGMSDYVAQIASGQRGLRDYAQFNKSESSSSMDDSPESF